MARGKPFRNRTAARWLARLARDRRAATAVEYGLVLALVVLVMIVALVELASVTTGVWNNVSSKVQSAH